MIAPLGVRSGQTGSAPPSGQNAAYRMTCLSHRPLGAGSDSAGGRGSWAPPRLAGVRVQPANLDGFNPKPRRTVPASRVEVQGCIASQNGICCVRLWDKVGRSGTPASPASRHISRD
jgi:hypothetical protein